MPTAGRLRGRRAFADLAQRGRTVRSGPLRVRFLAAPGGPSIGYAISKKVGTAVVRNRIRRRLRAACASTNALTSGFYLISPDASAASAPFDQLVGALDNAFTSVAR